MMLKKHDTEAKNIELVKSIQDDLAAGKSQEQLAIENYVKIKLCGKTDTECLLGLSAVIVDLARMVHIPR